MALPQDFLDMAQAVNNWGRWGVNDDRGTLNLVTPEVVRSAAAEVLAGRRFSLALPLSADGPQVGTVPGRINPLRTMIAIHEPVTGDPGQFCSNDDIVVMGLQSGTHWDSLVHASYAGRLYNGLAPSTVGAAGASRCGIERVGPLVSRGVLLDVARALGVDRLEPGFPIGPAELDAAETLARVTVASGDIVLIRTGHLQLFKARDRKGYAYSAPGLRMSAASWLHTRDAAAVATDTLSLDVWPPADAGVVLPVHLLHLVEMGLTQGQNFDLEELAADCAADGRYRFLLAASPEPFVGGLGSPVHPVAVK
ncbi:MAG: cyclase family protein [Mycobacteriales bacterium]